MGISTPRNKVREREVLKWRKRELTNAQIAKKLGVSRQRIWAIIERVRKEGRL